MADECSYDLFLYRLEEVRLQHRFAICGYVVMPEHFHLLVTEPAYGNLSRVMQVLKQRVARELLKTHRHRTESNDNLQSQFWQRRFYDFNVWTEKKRIEKLRYIHRNPVKRGLVTSPEEWKWSSFRYYSQREKGPVTVDAF